MRGLSSVSARASTRATSRDRLADHIMSANTPPKQPPKTPSPPSKEDILLTQEMYHKLRPQLVLASLGALLAGIAYVFLPAQLTIVPTWLPLALAILVLIRLFYIV